MPHTKLRVSFIVTDDEDNRFCTKSKHFIRCRRVSHHKDHCEWRPTLGPSTPAGGFNCKGPISLVPVNDEIDSFGEGRGGVTSS